MTWKPSAILAVMALPELSATRRTTSRSDAKGRHIAFVEYLGGGQLGFGQRQTCARRGKEIAFLNAAKDKQQLRPLIKSGAEP